VHINDTHENRHNRAHTRREAETRRLSEERVRRERTGMLISTESHAVVKKSLLTKLQEESQFGAQELRNVMSSFQKHADPAKYSLSRDAFSEVVKELFDNITPKLCAELFDAMDVDGSGTVDYGELVTGCAKVVHDLSTEDRFKMIFEAYDRDGSGMIDTTDLMRIAEEKGEQLSQSMDLVHNMIVSLDTHGKGYIDFSDFMTAVESTPILVDAFECLLPSPALLKKHVPALEKATGSKFDWARLNDLVTFIRTCGGGTAGRDDAEKITRAGFRSMMEDFFGFHDEEVTGLFFDAMDSDDSGIISFKELMQGLSTALRSTPQQRAEFFFKMYDDAGTGTVGRFQLQSLLGRGQHALNKLNGEASKSGNYKQHGAGAQQQLEAHGMMMDTGGDGRVSHAEFVAAINQNPQLLHLFDCCVH
jgi:Ca2+-binding EF-hand superfamily protein